MPTTRTINIRPSGGNYTTLAAAATAEVIDLTLSDEILEFVVWDEFGGYLDEGANNVDMTPYTTDQTRYIVIRANAGDEYDFGTDTGAKFKFTNKNVRLRGNSTTHVVVKNLRIHQDIGDVNFANSHAQATRFENCRITTTVATQTSIPVLLYDFNRYYAVQMQGCMVERAAPLNHALVDGLAFDPTGIDGCVFINGYVDFASGSHSFDMTDTVIYNSAGTTVVNTAGKTGTIDNNAFSDATGIGTNKIVSIPTTVFQDFGGGDYRSASGQSLFAAGIGILAASGASVTIDQSELIPGQTISGSYSGFVPGTPPTSPISISDGTNSITVAITPTDGGSGSGTFTGTMPTLPTAGNTANFLKFGNVTVTLDDA